MPSKKLNVEQAALQKIRLAEEVERRKAAGIAGKQKNLAGKLKELLPSALENIKHVVEGTGDIDKNRYDASKWIVTQTMTTEKHAHELKLRRLAAKKAEAEANAGMPVIFAVCEAVRSWLADNNVKGLDDASMYAQMMRKTKEAERREVSIIQIMCIV